ncbi:MAG: hypothetical protein AAB654_20720, partial [Acidobacteriota bacterium]
MKSPPLLAFRRAESCNSPEDFWGDFAGTLPAHGVSLPAQVDHQEIATLVADGEPKTVGRPGEAG